MDINLIQNRIEILQKAREELKLERMLREEELRNSEKYRLLKDKIKADIQELKLLVNKNLIAAGIGNKIQSINEEIRDLTLILDYELLNFNRETNRNQIEDLSGRMYMIKFHSIIKRTNQSQLNLED